MSDDFHDWPFVPTGSDWTWDFDRATDFDLQPLYIPAEGVHRREAIARLPRRTEAEQVAYDEALAAATASDDVTTFLLDQAPRMYRLLRSLIYLDEGELGGVFDEAQAIVSAIQRDVRSYR